MTFPIPRRRSIRAYAGVLGVALLGLPPTAVPLAAQEDDPAIRGVILYVETTEAPLPLTGEQTAATYTALTAVCPLIGSLAHASSALPVDLFETAGSIGESMHRGIVNLCQSADWLGEPPPTVTADYKISFRPDQLRSDGGDLTMFWTPAQGTRGARMWFVDPATGQYLDLHGDLGQLDLTSADQGLGVGTQGAHSGTDISPIPGTERSFYLPSSGTYTARKYSYSYTTRFAATPGPLGALSDGGTLALGIQTTVEGEAWIAEGVPGRDQITAFYHNFAASFDDQGLLGGPTSEWAAFYRYGVPLEYKETNLVSAFLTLPEEFPIPAELAAGPVGNAIVFPFSASEETVLVTDVELTLLPDEEFFGEHGPPPTTPAPVGGHTPVPDGDRPPECDCSCDAFQELQDMDEDDPDVMARARCAQQCMSRWIGCAAP